MIKIEVVVLDPECLPEKHGDWIDLKCSKDIEMTEGGYVRIPLGIKVNLPEGTEAHVLPRSSTFERYGIMMANSQGVIDNEYSGEWHFPAHFTKKTVIPKYTRIAQFRITSKMPAVRIEPIEELPSNKNRGGFGHTGY